MELLKYCPECKGSGFQKGIKIRALPSECATCHGLGLVKATPKDILRKAKELIEVSDVKIKTFIKNISISWGMIDTKADEEDTKIVLNFISSLFEEVRNEK